MKAPFQEDDRRRPVFTYSGVGVNRIVRGKIRSGITNQLERHWKIYPRGKPLLLPFGPIFPVSRRRDSFFDVQTEGIGTKTLLAEIDPEGYSSIGVDGVAMVANDVVRSGAVPLILADALHVARSGRGVESIVKGITKGAEIAGCVLSSGETGDVPEVLHHPMPRAKGEPFDLIVSCLGIAKRNQVIKGRVNEGDVLIGIESSGIHANGISLARRILLRRWGGKYNPHDVPEGLSRSIIKELLEPTRIYVREILHAVNDFGLKAAVHITGDGFAKFQRLLAFQSKSKGRVGLEIDHFGPGPLIFDVIEETSKKMGRKISRKEMFQTFNMGYGFAVVSAKENADHLVDLFNKYHPAKRIGRLTKSGKIMIRDYSHDADTIIL